MDWKEDEIIGPNVESRETLLELAKMTNNAYLEPDDAGWYSLNETWNVVRLFPFFLAFFFPLSPYLILFSLILSDGNQTMMVFAVTYLPQPITQR